MLLRRVYFLLFLVTCLFTTTHAGPPTDQSAAPQKELVTDGHVVHTLGNLGNHVTNWGLIGSQPTRPTTYSQAPSARWPGPEGIDYLWSAGLWIGGIVLGEQLVSTGQYDYEIMASSAPGDTIFGAGRYTPGGNRFPWPGADDDGDGREDEDPLDGLDNDGDGLVDEDFAAVGDQGYYCTMTDNTPAAVSLYPDHTPLNVSVSQSSFQWTDPLAADFIGYEYTVTNIGVTDIEHLYCGLFSDFDIGNAQDDLAGGWWGPIRAADGSWVPVAVAYMRDGAQTAPAPGWAGWVMCGLFSDAADLPTIPARAPTLQIFDGTMAFAQGGDPSNDAQRYQALSAGTWDADVPDNQVGDYRVLIAAEELATLAPGQDVTLRLALVVGASRDEMLAAAAEAVLTAYGEFFDRDGDAGNGAEFQVPWLRPGEAPVSAVPEPVSAVLTLDAAPNPFNPRVTFSFAPAVSGPASLTIHDLRGRRVRTLLAAEPVTAPARIVWDGTDDAGRKVASGVYVARLVAGSQLVERRVALVR